MNKVYGPSLLTLKSWESWIEEKSKTYTQNKQPLDKN